MKSTIERDGKEPIEIEFNIPSDGAIVGMYSAMNDIDLEVRGNAFLWFAKTHLTSWSLGVDITEENIARNFLTFKIFAILDDAYIAQKN